MIDLVTPGAAGLRKGRRSPAERTRLHPGTEKQPGSPCGTLICRKTIRLAFESVYYLIRLGFSSLF